MLREANELIGLEIMASGEAIGKIQDILFDHTDWKIQYLVAENDGLWNRESFLIYPSKIQTIDRLNRVVSTTLQKSDLSQLPKTAEHLSISEQMEDYYSQYLGWPEFSNTGGYIPPRVPPEIVDLEEREKAPHQLRSYKAISGYGVRSADDTFGYIENMIVDDQNWSMRYFVVNTRSWFPGKAVLLATNWTDLLSWSRREIRVPFTKQKITGAPYFPPSVLDRAYEAQVFDYFGRNPYWMKEIVRDDLLDLLIHEGHFHLLEVEDRSEFKRYHLPGAVNIPVESSEFERTVNQLVHNKGCTIVLYAKNNASVKPQRAAGILSLLGYQDILIYPDGKEEWRAAGLEVAA